MKNKTTKRDSHNKNDFVDCKAWGRGGECYYTLSMTPGCWEKPCQIIPGRRVGGIGSYKYRIHPSDSSKDID